MKRLATICALAAAATLSHGQAASITGQAVDQFGAPLPFAQVRVCNAATSTGTPCNPTTPIYQDYMLTIPAGNPWSGDQFGNYQLYAPALPSPNLYVVQLSPASGITWSYVYNGPSTGGGGGGIPYPPGTGFPTVIAGTAWGVTYPPQGTDTNVLTSGAVSGVLQLLCTDAQGGATTVGCPTTSGGVTGTGIPCYIPIWTTTTNLGSSPIFYSAGCTATLTVPATTEVIFNTPEIAVNGTGSQAGFALKEGVLTPTPTAGFIDWWPDSASNWMKFNPNAIGNFWEMGVDAAGTAGQCWLVGANNYDATAANCPSITGGIEQLLYIPPGVTQYIIVRPTVATPNSGCSTGAGLWTWSATNGTFYQNWNANGGTGGGASWNCTLTESGFALPAGFSGTINAIYAVGQAVFSGYTVMATNVGCTVTSFTCGTVLNITNGAGVYNADILCTSSCPGSSVPNFNMIINSGGSGSWPSTSDGTVQGDTYLVISYTGTVFTQSAILQVVNPLIYSQSNNTLSLSPFATVPGFNPLTVGQLPQASQNNGNGFWVSDANETSGTCTGGGTNLELCQSNGTIYQVITPGGSSGFPITLGSTSVAASSTTSTIGGLTLTSPTLVTPALGTPASGVLTNTTGLPAASVVSGALANGMTATTQTTGDNTTKLATDAFVIANAGSGGGSNGTVTYTSAHTLASGDNGKLVIMNCSSACAVTLPATQPSTTFEAGITTQGSSVATVTLGGSDTFNGTTNVPLLNSFTILTVFANTASSTDYRGNAPLVAGSGISITPSSNGLSVSASAGASAVVNLLLQGGVSHSGCTLTSNNACTANSSSPIVVSGIPGTGTNINIVCSGQAFTNGADAWAMQLNGDTSADYNGAAPAINASGAYPAQYTGGTSANLGYINNYFDSTLNAGNSSLNLMLNNYSQTVANIGWVGQSGASTGTFNTAWNPFWPIGTWLPATKAAVTSIAIFPASGNGFTSNSTCSFYLMQ